MRLTICFILVITYMITSNAVAEQNWSNEHHYSYYSDRDRHHNLHSHHNDQYYSDDYSWPNYNTHEDDPYYSQRTSSGSRSSSTQSSTHKSLGQRDFYYFKKNQPSRAKRPKNQANKFQFESRLALSSLDVEDKRKKQKHPIIPRVSGKGIRHAKTVLAMTRRQCHRMLRQQKVKFSALAPTWGIKYPVKIHSTIGGVRYRHRSNHATYSIMDCRLAVSLHGWSKILKQYGVYEVVHMRIYSPGATVRKTGKLSGHSWGLAIDVAQFKSRQYGELNVKYDWSDQRRNISPCIKSPKSSQALRLLRAIVCQTANRQLFAMILTPHYNRAHHDHLHIELSPRLRKLVLR